MGILINCLIISGGSEQSTKCQEISLISTRDGRKGSWNELTAQSSTFKLIQARDRLCQGKHIHTCVHTHMHHQPRTSTSSSQCQTPVRGAPRDMEVYPSSSFCYRSPVHCQSRSWLTRVRQLARVPYPAPGQSETTYCCISGPVCYKDLKNWDFIFRSWCFFSIPATPSFQDLLDKRLKLLSQAMVLPVLCRYQSPRTLC